MGAYDGLPPHGGFPTLKDRLERAFSALDRGTRQKYQIATRVPRAYSEEDSPYNAPMRWRRRAQKKEYMEYLLGLTPVDRAAHGIAVKLLRIAMGEYRLGLAPFAIRALLDENQTKLYGVSAPEFAEHVGMFANRLLRHGCTAAVRYESVSRSLELALLVTREPRFVPPPVEYYNFTMV